MTFTFITDPADPRAGVMIVPVLSSLIREYYEAPKNTPQEDQARAALSDMRQAVISSPALADSVVMALLTVLIANVDQDTINSDAATILRDHT